VICLAIGALALLAIALGWVLSGMEPAWYRQRQADSPSLAREAEDQLHQLQTWADATYVQQLAKSRGRTLSVLPPAPRFELDLTEAELQSVVNKWAMLANRPGEVPVLAAVGVRLRENEICVGAKLPQWMGERIVSAGATVLPEALSVGTPRLGHLPLPRWALPLREVCAEQQREAGKARMDAGGLANESAVRASGLRLLGDLQVGEVREHRLILPLATPIPVHVQLKAEHQRLRLTFTPLSGAARLALLDELQRRP
jgi:hypothetical protein